tara:strand:- start:11570 stop:12481 length:912 start_codon:yes stop_codon:yes gene_type:complete
MITYSIQKILEVFVATSISLAIEKFKNNLQITMLQESTVSTRQTNVRNVIQSDMIVLDSFLTGSYRRCTLISPLSKSDIDIFIILDPKYFRAQNNGPANLLDQVKRVLQKTFTKTPKISRNGQAVTITFTDFMVDIVPAFHRKNGGFLIPNSTRNIWISTDPKIHVEILTKKNQIQNGKLIPLIKMIKAWNRIHNSFFQSFHLEVLALEVFDNIIISDYPSGVRYFFQKASKLVLQENLDPSGYGGDVGSYQKEKNDEYIAQSALQKAYIEAWYAEESVKVNNVAKAIKHWQNLFGDYFPSYG